MLRASRVVSTSACEQGLITWTTFRVLWNFVCQHERRHAQQTTKLPRIGAGRDFWSLVAACWVIGAKCVLDEDSDANLIAAQTFPGIKSSRHVLRAELRLLCALDWRMPRP